MINLKLNISSKLQGGSMKNILMISTGGTIASSKGENGLQPEYEVEELINFLPSADTSYKVTGKSLMKIDSSNMTPNDWIKIARTVYDEYNNYDGFVITHGTDTMAYTSCALTYMLTELDKPVILTGSQYPISKEHTDAIQNLNDSLKFASEQLAGVFILFDGKLISGTRAVKVKTRSYDAFESINFPYIAHIKHNKIEYKRFVVDNFRPNGSKMVLNDKINENIAIIKLFPGISSPIFECIKNNYKAVIIESFGIGGVPFEQIDIASEIIKLLDAGVIVLMTTQCLEEGVDFGIYEVGKILPSHKLIYANDMTTESSVAKLMCALGRFNDFNDIKHFIEHRVQFDI